MSGRTKIYLALAASAALLLVLLRTPSRVVLDASCHPQGTVNNLRAALQGSRYWRSQLALLDVEVKWIENFPRQMAKADSLGRWAKARTDSILDSVYVANPKLRPILKQSAADSLREVANRLDETQARRLIDSFMTERQNHLILCRDSVLGRAAR